MPQPPERRRLLTWFNILRDRAPDFWYLVKEWAQAVRAEPRLFLQTPVVRYVLYALGGIVGIVLISNLVRMFEPAGTGRAQPQATTALFDVICNRTACGHHFVIDRKFSFDDFPVVCPQCRQRTGRQALRCYSPTCGGRLVTPHDRNGELICNRCAERVAHRR